MTNIIRTFSYALELQPLIVKAEKRAEKEHVSFGALVIKGLSAYLNLTGSEHQSLDGQRFPDAWTSIGSSELKSYSWKDEDEMVHRLESNLSAIKNDRQTKRDEEMRTKGLRPKA